MNVVHSIIKSPAMLGLMLLYGILIPFVVVYYSGIGWLKLYTILFYAIILILTAIIVSNKFRVHRPSLNRIDILFIAFLFCVVASSALNWREGTASYLIQVPALFLAPYFVGRVMSADDCIDMRKGAVFMGLLLLIAIIPEYIRTLKYGLPYVDSPAPRLFELDHGVMLSGLVLAAAFVSNISIILSADDKLKSLSSRLKWSVISGFILAAMITYFILWISSRGGILAAIVGGLIVIAFAFRVATLRAILILLVISLSALFTSYSVKDYDGYRKHYTSLLKPYQLLSLKKDIRSAESLNSSEMSRPILGENSCNEIVDSISDRWIHYQQAIHMFILKPLSGVGANHYGLSACQGAASFPHSTLLQVIAELGGLVGIVYCALIWFAFSALIQIRKCSNSYIYHDIWSWFIAFAAMQVMIAQINGNYFVSAALYFTIGVAAGARNVIKGVMKETE